MPRILITGSNGQVGFELRRALAPLGEVIALTRRDVDLGDPENLVAALNLHQPDLIVNPAAYTAVDKAESEPELARAVNAGAPGAMAQWGQCGMCLLFTTRLIMYSKAPVRRRIAKMHRLIPNLSMGRPSAKEKM